MRRAPDEVLPMISIENDEAFPTVFIGKCNCGNLDALRAVPHREIAEDNVGTKKFDTMVILTALIQKLCDDSKTAATSNLSMSI